MVIHSSSSSGRSWSSNSIPSRGSRVVLPVVAAIVIVITSNSSSRVSSSYSIDSSAVVVQVVTIVALQIRVVLEAALQ